MCGFLGQGAASFEIRDVAGDTDMLIGNGGSAPLWRLRSGTRSVVLMRGHGSTVVGSSLEQAVYRPFTPRSTPGCRSRPRSSVKLRF